MPHRSSTDATIATIDLDSTKEEAEIVEMLDGMEAVMAVEMAVDAKEEAVLVDIVIETETTTVTVRDSLAVEKAKMEKIKS